MAKPLKTPPGQIKPDTARRAERLAEALRENLKKRKDQARARDEAGAKPLSDRDG